VDTVGMIVFAAVGCAVALYGIAIWLYGLALSLLSG